jgi:hypothetical protein
VRPATSYQAEVAELYRRVTVVYVFAVGDVEGAVFAAHLMLVGHTNVCAAARVMARRIS